MKHFAGFTFAVAAAVVCFSQSQASAQSKKPPQVPIAGSHVRTLHSKDTGRTYDIYIRPANPDSVKDGKVVPVLYGMDGQWDFKLYEAAFGGLKYDKFVPDMVIVGITYSGENPDYGKLREMDLTPVPLDLPGQGDSAKFLSFLKKDVFPMIEKNYGADPSNRVLSGSSLGGLFTLWTLFTEPDLFRGYIASSPYVPYADNYVFKQEAKFFEKRKDLAKRLYITVGSEEDLEQPVLDIIKVIKQRSYKGLTFESRVIEGEGHASNKPESYNRGLRFIFSNQ
ncbi:MAG: alpha/beta hydrolase-fold protein [Pyrinomonadaceae bacterium]